MTEPTKARRGLDKLLASYPDAAIEKLDWQLARVRTTTRDTHSSPLREALAQPAGPWVCIDLTNGGKFAIWKHTGNVYRVGKDGAVEDDPILTVDGDELLRDGPIMAAYEELRMRGHDVTYEDATAALQAAQTARDRP